MPATRWSSHKDIAAKALKKLAGPHVPASLTRLEQAVKRAHAAYDKAETAGARAAARRAPAAEPRPTTASATSSTRTSTRPRSRRRPLAGRLATRWWHALAGVRVAGDRPASGAGPEPRREPTMARRFNRKPLTDEERDARRKADRDRIEQAARALLTSDGWQRWIKVRASNGLSQVQPRQPDA